MSKFISKKYRASFEDVTNEFEGVVKEETGLDVDTVINGLDNDIELMEAGKEYISNKDRISEALSVVDNLQELKEANDKLIESGEVTGDDVLASQEALMQAGALLGLDIQSISFESISIDPKQALVISNEGIIESIDKGITAVIKFFKDLFSSIWKFITGLFGKTEKIKDSNELTIRMLDKVVDNKEVNTSIQKLTSTVINNGSPSDIEHNAKEYGSLVARFEGSMSKIKNLPNFDESVIAKEAEDVAIAEANNLKDKLEDLKGASVLCGVCGVAVINPNTVRVILETMDQVVGFKAFHRIDNALANMMEEELKFITELNNRLLPIAILESSWNKAKIDTTGQALMLVLDKLKEAVSKLAQEYNVTYDTSKGISEQIEEVCVNIMQNKFKDYEDTKGLKEDPIKDLETFVKYYDHVDHLEQAFIFPVLSKGSAISLSFNKDDLTQAGSTVVLKRFLGKSATSIENGILEKSLVEPLVGILSHTNNASDSIAVTRYINKYISLYNIKDMHMLSRVEQNREVIFRYIDKTQENITRSKLDNTIASWLVKHYSRMVISNLNSYSAAMQQPINNMGRVYKVLSGYIKINAKMLVKLGIKKES